MFTSKIRHGLVAVAILAVAGATVASAAGFARRDSVGDRALPPQISGDLGEVVVYAPHDLGEIVVYAPRDLADIQVRLTGRSAVSGDLGEIVVTAPRMRRAIFPSVTEAGATLAMAD